MCLGVRKLFVLFTNPCNTDKETSVAAFQRQQWRKKERWVFLCLAAPINPFLFWNAILKIIFLSPVCNPIAGFTSIITKQLNVGAVRKTAARNAEPICLKTPQVLVTILKHQGYCVWRVLFHPQRGQIPENILGYYVRFKWDLFLKDYPINQFIWYKSFQTLRKLRVRLEHQGRG